MIAHQGDRDAIVNHLSNHAIDGERVWSSIDVIAKKEYSSPLWVHPAPMTILVSECVHESTEAVESTMNIADDIKRS